ncbi:MAG: RpiB/LacA/LacB family sugar-phosphate isomerase [Spirochaetia bacterium]|jgi:ribose 5-phosphate isomerase RpiB|nr:RpiB/LacA/LacB family sugar-phosphate isomerase [Spirochaetia bacterium]
MRVAVINEVSAADKNPAIMAGLEGRGLELINAGMRSKSQEPQLLYTHTGFMSALLIHLDIADLVIGGCGTGQGYLNSVMQYPGMFCGHLLSPLDAWLFARINSGNCVSLALNQGYGWAGEINLQFVFDRLFSVEWGSGYPVERREPQSESRDLLKSISDATHKSLPQIILSLPDSIVLPSLNHLMAEGILNLGSPGHDDIKQAARQRLGRV